MEIESIQILLGWGKALLRKSMMGYIIINQTGVTAGGTLHHLTDEE